MRSIPAEAAVLGLAAAWLCGAFAPLALLLRLRARQESVHGDRRGPTLLVMRRDGESVSPSTWSIGFRADVMAAVLCPALLLGKWVAMVGPKALFALGTSPTRRCRWPMWFPAQQVSCAAVMQRRGKTVVLSSVSGGPAKRPGDVSALVRVAADWGAHVGVSEVVMYSSAPTLVSTGRRRRGDATLALSCVPAWESCIAALLITHGNGWTGALALGCAVIVASGTVLGLAARDLPRWLLGLPGLMALTISTDTTAVRNTMFGRAYAASSVQR
ncbi:MAG: hypothetical protein ACYDAG_04275 [Chloroflexota bacterium]